eukprot:3773346-Rhodomonas_salina.4
MVLTLSAFACGLAYGMHTVLRTGTDIAYGRPAFDYELSSSHRFSARLRSCYAMSSTAITYATAYARAMRCPVARPRYRPTHSLCDVRYCDSLCLSHPPYAMSGTDILTAMRYPDRCISS